MVSVGADRHPLEAAGNFLEEAAERAQGAEATLDDRKSPRKPLALAMG